MGNKDEWNEMETFDCRTLIHWIVARRCHPELCQIDMGFLHIRARTPMFGDGMTPSIDWVSVQRNGFERHPRT